MLLGSPDNTPYDLRFRLLAIPVRVHPLFWLVMVVISGASDDLLAAAVFVACAFVSVLVHELGHGLSSRAFGGEPDGIVLYAMGGFCVVPVERLRRFQKFVMYMMGPFAGFALLGLVLLLAKVVYGVSPVDAIALIGFGPGSPLEGIRRLPPSPALRMAFFFLIEINVLWGLLNLLPLWPLDGGRMTEVLLEQIDRRSASRRAHVLSLLTAGVIAVVFAMQHQYMMAVWFGYFGFINYQLLHARYEAAKRGDGGWWES